MYAVRWVRYQIQRAVNMPLRHFDLEHALMLAARRSYRQYLTTLRRIPRDIVLALATREFNMFHGKVCLVGWAVREQLARLLNSTPEEVDPYDFITAPTCILLEKLPVSKATELFGGTHEEWESVYSGTADHQEFPLIERAFLRRVLECTR